MRFLRGALEARRAVRGAIAQPDEVLAFVLVAFESRARRPLAIRICLPRLEGRADGDVVAGHLLAQEAAVEPHRGHEGRELGIDLANRNQPGRDRLEVGDRTADADVARDALLAKDQIVDQGVEAYSGWVAAEAALRGLRQLADVRELLLALIVKLLLLAVGKREAERLVRRQERRGDTWARRRGDRAAPRGNGRPRRRRSALGRHDAGERPRIVGRGEHDGGFRAEVGADGGKVRLRGGLAPEAMGQVVEDGGGVRRVRGGTQKLAGNLHQGVRGVLRGGLRSLAHDLLEARIQPRAAAREGLGDEEKAPDLLKIARQGRALLGGKVRRLLEAVRQLALALAQLGEGYGLAAGQVKKDVLLVHGDLIVELERRGGLIRRDRGREDVNERDRGGPILRRRARGRAQKRRGQDERCRASGPHHSQSIPFGPSQAGAQDPSAPRS